MFGGMSLLIDGYIVRVVICMLPCTLTPSFFCLQCTGVYAGTKLRPELNRNFGRVVA